MDEKILCACCNHEMDFESLPVCDRCGFINQIFIGDVDTTDKDARDHRRKLIAQLKDISIICYEYGWDDDNKVYAQLFKEEHKIADGPECDGKIVWASYEFGQWVDETEKTVPVELSFMCNGRKYSVTSKFLPMKSDSFWHVGVTITTDMQLVICFGTKAKYASSSGYDFVALLPKS